MTPRAVALILGLSYAVLTVVELLVGEWSVAGASILDRTTKANLLHWALALVLLGSFYAGKDAGQLSCRIVGIAMLALTVWGLLSASTLGAVLGYSPRIHGSYQVLHALTALVAIWSGFKTSRPREA